MATNEQIFERLGRMDEKLDTALKTGADHEIRVSSLETDRTKVFTIASVVSVIGMAVSGFIGWFK